MCEETENVEALYVRQFLVYLIPCYLFILTALYSKCIAKPKLNKINSSRSEPLLSGVSQNSKGLITSINYYIFYKCSIAISLIYFGLILHSLFFSDDEWFLCQNLSLSLIYIFPALAWLLSANMVNILFVFQFEIISWEVRGFWIVSFLFDSIEILTKPGIMVVKLLDLFRIFLLLVLFAYALARPWTCTNKVFRSNDHNTTYPILKSMNNWLEKFEKNFYVRAIFLGDILEKQIQQHNQGKIKRTNSAISGDLELSDANSNDRLKTLYTRFENTRTALAEEEEDDFVSSLPNIRTLFWTDIPTADPSYGQADPRIYFTIYTYLTFDIQNRKEIKCVKKYSDMLDLERDVKNLYSSNAFFKKVPEFRKLHICEFENDDIMLRRERIKILESYFNNDLLKEPDCICPIVLTFLGISEEDYQPFDIFWEYRLRTKKVKTTKKLAYSKQASKNSCNNVPEVDAASIEEVFEEEDEDDEFSKNKFYAKEKRITNSAPRTIDSKQLAIDNSFLPSFDVKVENAAFENDQVYFNIRVKEKSNDSEWTIQKTFADITQLNSNLEFILKKEINLLKFSHSKSIGADDETSRKKRKNDVENFLRGILINPNCMGDVLYEFLEFDNLAFKRRLARNFSDIFSKEDDEIVRKVSCLEKHETPVPLVRDKNAFARTNSLQKNAKIHKSFTSYFRGLSKISIPFYEIKDNAQNEPLFTIYYDEYYSESSDKIRRRIIVTKVLSELEQLHFDLVKFYQPFEKRMPILNAEIKKKDKIFEFLKRTEEYFNEILKLPNLENCEEFIKFFNLKSVSEKSKSSQGGMLVYNFSN